jgi:SAM-dependent methyltransferase
VSRTGFTSEEWAARYAVNASALPPELNAAWVPLGPDAELAAYGERAAALRLGRVRTWLQRLLSAYVSHFDANALLGAYPTHLLGREQWGALFERAGVRHGRFLDIGAGSGDVTLQVAPWFGEVHTTEVARAAARRLRRRGLASDVRDVTHAGAPAPPYDAVGLLNVLDRCNRPRTLLSRACEALRPGGHLLLSLVLPYRPVVYAGPYVLSPEEELAADGPSWEAAAARLTQEELEPRGLSVRALTRVPYCVGGDAARALYVLDAGVWVAERTQ